MARSRSGFTLIELLVVVAIIGILAAIAASNFLEAQVRAKVSRVLADLQSIATGLELYRTDQNEYPPGYNTAPRYGLVVLTTPISYLGSAIILDPFAATDTDFDQRAVAYELMTADGKLVERPAGPYSSDPTVPGSNVRGAWWWMASRGPDKRFGFQLGEEEYNLRERLYEAGTNAQGLMDAVYDPTNGTYSFGNIYRLGGSDLSPAGRVIESCMSR